MIVAGERLANMRDELVVRPSEITYNKVEPASIDFHWTDEFRVYTSETIDAMSENPIETIQIPDEWYVLETDKIYLFTTAEKLLLPNSMVATCEGRSSIGRLGLQIHSTAWYVDPGWRGQITLEVSAVQPVRVYPWMRIGQFAFYDCDESVGYDGRYQDQVGVVESKYHIGETK